MRRLNAARPFSPAWPSPHVPAQAPTRWWRWARWPTCWATIRRRPGWVKRRAGATKRMMTSETSCMPIMCSPMPPLRAGGTQRPVVTASAPANWPINCTIAGSWPISSWTWATLHAQPATTPKLSASIRLATPSVRNSVTRRDWPLPLSILARCRCCSRIWSVRVHNSGRAWRSIAKSATAAAKRPRCRAWA